jgi:hypothetical protein
MSRKKTTIDTGTPEELAALKTTREWRAATKQQRIFLLNFLTTGDAKSALLEAYPSAGIKSRRALQWQVLRAQAVVNILEIWKWRSPREALIAILKEQLKAAVIGSTAAKDFTVQLERLLIGIQGTNKAHFQDPADDTDEPSTDETSPPADGSADKRIPEGAQVWYDNNTGACIGYRTADGKDVKL